MVEPNRSENFYLPKVLRSSIGTRARGAQLHNTRTRTAHIYTHTYNTQADAHFETAVKKCRERSSDQTDRMEKSRRRRVGGWEEKLAQRK